MKKHVLFIATAAAMLAGCAKEVEKPAEEQTGKLYTITALVDNPETRTLTENDGTNKYKFSWDTGENISVVSVNPSSKLLFQVSDTENGTFTYQAKPDETYGGFGMAVTPGYALGENPTVNNYSIEFSGDYVYGQSNAIMIAGTPTIAGENYKFQFKHAAALVQVTYNNVPVGTKAMVLTSANNITGTANLTSATGVSIATDDLSGTPGKVAKVSFGEALTQPMSTAVFYVPIPIGSYQSFDIKLVNNSDVEIPGSAFTISAGSAVNVKVGNVLMFPAKTVTNSVTKGREYTLPISSSNKFSAYGTPLVYDNVSWVASKLDENEQGEPSDYAGTKDGQRFGSNGAPLTGVKVTCNNYASYCVSATAVGINAVQVTSSSNGDIIITQSVKVGGVEMTANPCSYTVSGNNSYTSTFTSPNLLTGTIEITYTNNAGSAIYIGNIVINPDARLDPEIAFTTSEYTVAAGATFTAPTPSTVDGFNGSLVYSTNNADVANVDSSTGAVTIGSTAGTAVITASFEGDETYKPSKATYTINVQDQATLTVSGLSASMADYLNDSVISFTVTSNLEWTASKNDDDVSNAAIKSITVDGNTVIVTFNANTGDERTAIVNVVPDDANFSSLAQPVSIKQSAYETVIVFEKYSGDLSEGDYLIVYDNGAMKASVSSNRLGYSTVSPENNKIKNPDASIIWHIAQDGNYWTLFNEKESQYAASTGTDNRAKLESNLTDNSRWSVSGNATYEFVNKANTGNKNLRRNGDFGFACYATGTGGALTLYKLDDNRQEPGIIWSSQTGTITLATGNNNVDVTQSIPSLTNPHSLQVTYSSTNQNVATVDADGNISWVEAGTTSIVAYFEGNESYRPTTVSFQLTVTDNRLQCAKPSFNPDGGSYTEVQTVSISTSTLDATIYYTTGNSDYSDGDWEQGNSITISSSCTLKAVAVKNGYIVSEVKTAAYIFGNNDPITACEWSRSGTDNTYTANYTFNTTFSAKTGYYQDNNGECYIRLYNGTTPMFTSAPTSITFTAKIGGGSSDTDLTDAVYVCLVDENGDDISGTATEVTRRINNTGGDTYSISIAPVTSASGVKLYHKKQSGYNVRYFSFSLSFIP